MTRQGNGARSGCRAGGRVGEPAAGGRPRSEGGCGLCAIGTSGEPCSRRRRSRRSVGRTGPEHHRHGSVHIRGGRRVPDPRQRGPHLPPSHRAARRCRVLHRLRIRHADPDAAIGNQTIARRGFIDLGGDHRRPRHVRRPGTEALNTRDFSPRTFQPGWNVELGYRFDDGTRLLLQLHATVRRPLLTGATLVPEIVNNEPREHVPVRPGVQLHRPAGSDSFAILDVYGIWNGATRWTSSSPSGTRR